METNGWVSSEEASAALASVERSRARVAWSGFPVWYWLATGACLSVGTGAVLSSRWWGLVVAAVAVVALIRVAYAAGRARGVCEGWSRSAMTLREGFVLYGPAELVILAGAVASRFVSWSPWLSLAAAGLVFVLFVGAGLTLSARSARR